MMQRKLFNLWTPASHTIGSKTSDSKFMENYSLNGDYDDHYDFVLVGKNTHTVENTIDTDPITEYLEVFAPALSAVKAEEGDGGDTTSAALVPSAVRVVDLIPETTVPRQELPEFNIQMFIVGATVFVVRHCCTTLKSWIERFLSQLGRLGIRWCGALRTLLVNICAWAARD